MLESDLRCTFFTFAVLSIVLALGSLIFTHLTGLFALVLVPQIFDSEDLLMGGSLDKIPILEF